MLANKATRGSTNSGGINSSRPTPSSFPAIAMESSTQGTLNYRGDRMNNINTSHQVSRCLRSFRCSVPVTTEDKLQVNFKAENGVGTMVVFGQPSRRDRRESLKVSSCRQCVRYRRLVWPASRAASTPSQSSLQAIKAPSQFSPSISGQQQ